MELQLEYGNWIRKKKLFILGLCTLGVGLLLCIPLGPLYRIIIALAFVMMLVSFLFPLYAYVIFSQHGGRFQEKVYELIIESLGATVRGKILDIGSGNGVLAVKLAQRHGGAEVWGIDHWGKDWEYSKGVCEKNARAARVDGRVHFQKGDAAELEFATDTFDGVISNLTFHEVKSVADKRRVLGEALRVVKPGGPFAFVDYFYASKYYGPVAEFAEYLRGMKLAQYEVRPLGETMVVPRVMKHPRILGKAGIIYGRK